MAGLAKSLGIVRGKGLIKGIQSITKRDALIGEKKNFNFINKMKMKLGYNMTEFALDKGSLNAAKFKDYVLCLIKRNVQKGRTAYEEDKRSANSATEEESDAAIEEEINFSNTMNPLMPDKSSLTNATFRFPISASEKYFSQNFLETDSILLPPFEQYCSQYSQLTDVIPSPESAEEFFQFSGLEEGTSNEQIASLDNIMMASELFKASTDCVDKMFPELFQNQEEVASSSALDNGMMDCKLFEESADWIDNMTAGLAQS